MIGNLSRRERRLVAGGVLVGVIVLGWTFVVQPLRERHGAAGELIPVREQILARRLELVARKSAIQGERDAVDARLRSVGSRFLTAATPAVAASELQKLTKDMATAVKTDVRSERILTPVERGELLEIPIEITVSCEIRKLVDLLAQIERAPKILSVQDLRVRVVNVSQPRELLATLTVSGFILPGKAKT
jgi:type II secretory pathway component PulM